MVAAILFILTKEINVSYYVIVRYTHLFRIMLRYTLTSINLKENYVEAVLLRIFKVMHVAVSCVVIHGNT